MKHSEWLRKELEDWEREALVEPAQAERLRARYPLESRGGRSAALIGFAVLGALLIGGGLILLLAYNWSDLGRPARTAVALAPLVLSQLLVAWGEFTNRQGAGWREGLGVFWTLSIGCAIAMVSQIYHLSGSYDQFILTWLLLAIPVVYVLRSTLTAILVVLGAISWSAAHVGDWPRVLLFWPLAGSILPLLRQSSRAGVFTSGLALLRWVLAGALLSGLGMSVSRGLPGLWLVLYASAFSLFYLADRVLLQGAPSLFHRPMRCLGVAGSVVLSLMLTYRWPWRQIGWHHWHHAVPMGHQWSDFILLGVLLSGVVITAVAARKSLRALDYFPSAFALVAVIGYALTAQSGARFGAQLLFNGFVFLYGVVALVEGIRRYSLASVNCGLLLLATVIALRFFDSDLGMLPRALVFLALGAGFLVVNVVLSRRMRRNP